MKAKFIGAVILCVFVCSADKMTTSAQNSTSEAPTTSSSNGTTEVTTLPATTSSSNGTNATSEAPTTAPTTQTPTTASPIPPFPAKSTYMVKDGNKTCIILEGGFQLEVKINNDTKLIDVPKSGDVTVSGTCASGNETNETNASLTITPKSGNDLVFLTLEFEIDAENKSQLASWNAEVKVDNKSFNFTAKKKQILADASMYYKCEKEGSFSDDDLTIRYQDLKVQAFNVENETFSKNGIDCDGDVGPIPSPGKIPDNMYSVREDNITCIVFKGEIEFDIPYKSTDGESTQGVGLPTVFSVSGTCNTTMNGLYSQLLTIHFYKHWMLNITISSDVKQGNLLTAGEKATKYSISRIGLQYELNSNLFTNVDKSVVGTSGEFVAYNLSMLETNAGKSYMCNKGATFGLKDEANNTLSMNIKNLRFEAFKEGDSTNFGDPNECAADEETNSIVPIAVGAALAGLVIIVLIAYLIGRKRSRKGYEQV